MRARTLCAALALAIGTCAANAGAQGGGATETEDDTVFDNTKKNEELARKRAADRRQKYQGDSPFAGDDAPDAVEKRERRFSPGVEGGYRAGYAISGGKVDKSTELDTNGMIFLWGDGGYRFIPQLFVGLFLSAGYVLPDCPENVDCTIWDFRVGPQVQWRFLPFADVTPWVGAGAGYELLLGSTSTEVTDASYTLHGFELFNVQGGVDFWAPTARGHVGVFAAYSQGRFTRGSLSVNDESVDDFDVDPDTHSWLYFGVHGTF